MVFLIICKNEDDPIKNEGARVFTTLYINFSDAQWQITAESVVVFGRNSNLSCSSLLHDSIKMKELEWSQHLFITSLWGFFQTPKSNSAVLSPTWPNFELIRDVMDVLVTCKNEQDSIKNEVDGCFPSIHS